MKKILSTKYLRFFIPILGIILSSINNTLGLVVFTVGLIWIISHINVKRKSLKIAKYTLISILTMSAIFMPFTDKSETLAENQPNENVENQQALKVEATDESEKKADIEAETKDEIEKKADIEEEKEKSIESQSEQQKQEIILKTTKELVNKNKELLDIKPKENHFFVKINNNKADFDYSTLKPEVYEKYSELDALGRVGVANAVLGKETMPTEARKSISGIYPTGWKQVKYDVIKTQDLYNHCHLIAFQLAAENDNPKNLMTGTRQFNSAGMTQFENKVADYIESTNNHVRYRVTPYFKDDELLARGVQMEAYSIEDNGKGINYNVYIYNTQKGVKLNYANGNSELIQVKTKPKLEKKVNTFASSVPKSKAPKSKTLKSKTTKAPENKPDKSSKLKASVKQRKYHHPGCRNYNRIKAKNAIYFNTIKEAENAGYIPAKCCN